MQKFSRRALLASPALPLLAQPAAYAPRIELTRLETFTLKVNHRGDWVLVRLHATGGLTGIGDASHGANDAATIATLKTYFELLKSFSIWDLERFRQEVFAKIGLRDKSASVAYSALEQCLWDIRGKALGLPVSDLLGGRLRDRIRNYANINRSTTDRTPAGFARMAESAVQAGFDAVKLAPWDGIERQPKDEATFRRFMNLGVDCAKSVREVLGPKRDLLCDVHSHMDLDHGLDLARQLEPLNLFWLEETTPAFADLATIRRATGMKTAGGESLIGLAGFYPYIAAGAVDTVMPDIKYAGGVMEVKKIAAMAEGAGLKVSPHGPASPIGNIVAAHICTTLPNFNILEFSHGEVPWRAEVLVPPEQLRAGEITVSSRPGFGVTLNEAALARHRA